MLISPAALVAPPAVSLPPVTMIVAAVFATSRPPFAPRRRVPVALLVMVVAPVAPLEVQKVLTSTVAAAPGPVRAMAPVAVTRALLADAAAIVLPVV